jgi:hypothetical protein
VIAAGYDTRAYRLARPGVKFYEIDLPHASRNKQELVRELLPADKVRLHVTAAAVALAMALLCNVDCPCSACLATWLVHCLSASNRETHYGL